MIRTGEGLIEREDGLYVPSHKTLLDRRWPGIGKVSYGTLRFAIRDLKVTGWLENEQGIGLRIREDHPA
jgi:hypothetical protein